MIDAVTGSQCIDCGTLRECPACSEEYVDRLEEGSYRTPPQIGDFWKICIVDGTVYVHDDGVNDWEVITDE